MPFRTPIKGCFGDIDNAGIVYYPRFMHYFHLAMEEFFAAEIGVDYAANVTSPFLPYTLKATFGGSCVTAIRSTWK